MTNKEKYLAQVSKDETDTVKEARERIKNREWLKVSREIALKVLNRLDEIEWSQEKLAEEMGVTPQDIRKIVSGKEYLTSETKIKLQKVLDIVILTTNSTHGKIVESKLYISSDSNDENQESSGNLPLAA